ncbi:MAG TPA: ATP synthase F1 subunit gamma [Thermoanaerobaculia bacterium]|jgi:F-type H+-transporting ATPase subunit gamma
MANRRALVKRRKAVRSTRKITRTMQLIATARYQAALNRVIATRPFTRKVAELLADLARAAGGLEHPLLKPNEGTKVSDLLVLTADRGLAGGYNANVLRAAIAHLDGQRAQGLEPRVHMVGKKGIAYFRFLRRPVAQQTSGIGDRPRFEQVEPFANALIDRYLRGEIASAHVAYMRFLSAGQQRPMVVQLLPLQPEVTPGEKKAQPVEYEFSPGPRQLLDELLPAIVRVQLFHAFNDAAASEQVARMVAMKAATDAAGDMIKALTRQYNRARQTQITMELLDIVGGADALS